MLTVNTRQLYGPRVSGLYVRSVAVIRLYVHRIPYDGIALERSVLVDQCTVSARLSWRL